MMDAAFLTELDVRITSPRLWPRGEIQAELLAPLLFYSLRFSGVFVAPAGLVTNFASIPRGAWNLYPRTGPWLRAAVLHDAGYEKGLQTEDGEAVHLVRRYCDLLFAEAMAVDGVPRHRRDLFCAFLEVFGEGVPGLVN